MKGIELPVFPPVTVIAIELSIHECYVKTI